MSEQTYTVEKLIGEPNHWDGGGDPKRATDYFTFKAVGLEKLCQIGRKPDNPLKVGDSFEATVKEDTGKLLKLKRISQGGYGGGGQKDYRADPAKLRGEAMRSAIHAASGYVTAMAGLGRVPESFKYTDMDPMIRHWFQLILEAQSEPTGGQS